ncbi:MAG: holo-ACP synthase [Porticoccaceae bacterium]|nr:holo-ACP synthase [Porticoccaceae bacterium]
MILGIGTDMVAIERIERALARHGERFAKRILGPAEYVIYRQSSRPVAHLAKRFAAKEAASKALGTGIGQVSWHDLEIGNDARGAPRLVLRGAAASAMPGARAWLSISDENGMAVAFVVIEGGVEVA